MIANVKISLGFNKLQKALSALEAIAFKTPDEDRSQIDATIQRFEFTIELFWKLLRAILEYKGVGVQYPKDVLRESFRGGLIDQEPIWLEMLQDRNMTSHTYEQELADAVYHRIQSYVPFLRKSLEQLEPKNF